MFSKSNGNGKGGHAVAAKPSVPSVLSADLKIVGNLSSDGEIHVDGTVDGDIRSRILLIGESAVIKGQIEAQSVSVHGTVLGQIRARAVNLARTARVTGDVLHETLSIDKGAYLEGHCRRLDRKIEGGDNKQSVAAVARTVEATATMKTRGSIAASAPVPAL
jgi:cytoskeletal protein CcmA (bactofilin family)